MPQTRPLRPFLLSLLLIPFAVASARAATPAAPTLRRVGSELLSALAPSIASGDHVLVDAIEVPATSELLSFDLQRFEVFAPDADVVVHGEGGRVTHLGRPKNTYFSGTVTGEPQSHVFLDVQPGGRVQGVVARHSDVDDDMYLIDSGADLAKTGARLQAERVDRVLLKSGRQDPFACDESKLPVTPPDPLLALAKQEPATGATADETTPPLEGLVSRTGRIAIETDYEFYQLFNSTTNATTYIGQLLGYASTALYSTELSTSLVVQSVSLWTTAADPWTQTNTLCGLFEFGRYWNQHHSADKRTVAHFLSGKPLGGGVAWLNALCHAPFTTGGASSCPGLGSETTAWGGDYGFSASISGSFNVNNPTVVWDLLAVSHEIGHNFGSPHSHCYNGLEGNASPIDQCYSGESGCYSGATSLPGPVGVRSGSVMSYCHLIGGYGAIAFSFGTNLAYGVQPGRESAHMNKYIASVASANPSCVALLSAPSIFSSGFEAGPLPGGWSASR